jgi:hypothetical protein
MNSQWEPRLQVKVISNPLWKMEDLPQLASVSFPRAVGCTMSISSETMGPSLTQEILSYLGLANEVGADEILGIYLLVCLFIIWGFNSGPSAC